MVKQCKNNSQLFGLQHRGAKALTHDVMLLPLQGEPPPSLYHRAMPWAISLLGFQPAFAERTKKRN